MACSAQEETEFKTELVPKILEINFKLKFSMETTGEQNINNERRDHISLLTFNVHAWGDAKHKANFSRVMEILRVLQPDVIGLNEVRRIIITPIV